ncbi:unnamed protein product [Leptosia nina]|uniref:Nuclear transport factor 2 domain-containing protein n=1 Tax=Leptosia nina TaxID=320188 RepID=A0AAV1J2C2_9NEOP
MSISPKTPKKRTSKFHIKLVPLLGKTNSTNKQQNAKNFINWYKQIVDNDRQKLGLYLSDDVTLKWFGRIIRTRKKVNSFFLNHVEYSKHNLTSVDSISKIRQNRSPRKSDSFESTICSEVPQQHCKRRLVQSPNKSPDWAPGCKPDDEFDGTDKKRSKHDITEYMDFEDNTQLNSSREIKPHFELNNKGDGIKHRKHEPLTPTNLECGQGDCLPSTSSDSDKSHEILNAQLSKLAVECNGYVEFTRTRSVSDSVKWERKCKLQISYSEDPLNVGEFIVWMICYSNKSNCRRNLLAEFNEVGKEEAF